MRKSGKKGLGKEGECKGWLIQCYQALGLQDCDCLLNVALARDVAILVADVGYVEMLVKSAQVVGVELSKGSGDGVRIHHRIGAFAAAVDLFDQFLA